jgi:hypothetical protein
MAASIVSCFDILVVQRNDLSNLISDPVHRLRAVIGFLKYHAEPLPEDFHLLLPAHMSSFLASSLIPP